MSDLNYGLAIIPDGKSAKAVVVRMDELGHSYAAKIEGCEWIAIDEHMDPKPECLVPLNEYAVKLAAAALIESLAHVDLGGA